MKIFYVSERTTKLLSCGDLQVPHSKSVTYLSHTSQNEMIEVIGKKIILKDIVEEMKKSLCFR